MFRPYSRLRVSPRLRTCGRGRCQFSLPASTGARPCVLPQRFGSPPPPCQYGRTAVRPYLYSS
jgi:hypothetical protein